MTSISQPPTIPPQGPNSSSASQAGNLAHSPSSSTSGGAPSTSPASSLPAVPAPARSSYASATKKQAAQASASVAASPPVAVGGPGAAQHAKAIPVSPVNGKTSGPAPAVPSIASGSSGGSGGGGNALNGAAGPPGHHSRKSSVTISAAGASGHLPNGGPVAGPPSRTNSIQFGSINAAGSPAATHASLQANSHLAPSAPVATPNNPRVTSPQTSPSPIPQPPASGGRPPSGLQGPNDMSFGSLPSDSSDGNVSAEPFPPSPPSRRASLTPPKRQMRPVSMPPQPPLATGPHSSHLRRESSHSTHSDASNTAIPPGAGPGPGRGGFPPHGGRGRGYGQPYSQHGQMGGFPAGSGYRPPPNQPRGNMGGQFQAQGGPMGSYPNSPHRGTRSPALTHVVPGTPQMQQAPIVGQQMQAQQYPYPSNMGAPQVNTASPFDNRDRPPQSKKKHHQHPHQHQHFHHQPLDLSLSFHSPAIPNLAPEYGFMEQYLMSRNLQTQFPYDPAYGGGPYSPQPPFMYPNMYMTAQPPSSPRPPPPPQHPYAGGQQSYVVGQYNQTQPQPMSRTSSAVSERPSSSMGQPPTPLMTPAATHSHQPSQGRNSPAASAASNFVRPTRKNAGIIIKDPKSGAVISPAPVSRSPAIVTSTPTPTPPPSRPAEPQHSRSDSKSIKSDEEKKNEMRDAIARKVEADRVAEKERADASEAQLSREKEAAEKARLEAEEKSKREKAELEEREAKEAAAEKARVEEEERLARDEAEATRREDEMRAKAEEERRQEAERAEAARTKALEEEEASATAAEKAKEAASKEKEAPATPAGLAAGVAKLSIDSGASTPASDDSMGPPSKPASAAKRDKPAALNLAPLKTNPVEPPQPSAALQALRSARFIDRIGDVTYPAAFASPNPALNAAATKGKFKYDKDFLLQFQPVFTEKPSIDWERRLGETVGDTSDSARPQSARTPSMGPRSTSGRPGLSNSFTMGTFGQAGNSSRPVPATSAERFAEANRSMNQPRATMSNPLAQFAGKPGGFQMGGPTPMSRTNSSSTLQNQGGGPNSPRGGGRGSRRDNMSKRNNTSEKQPTRREEEQAARTMPLTVGLDLKPLLPSNTGWKPRSLATSSNATGAAGPAPGASGSNHMEPDMVQRKVKSNLNKMTPEKFEKIADQILEIAAQSKDESDGRTLRQVIQLTFEKATDEAHWASMYAKFCKRMLESMSTDIKDESIRDKNGNVVAGGNLFRKYLLNRCQEEFERGWKLNLGDKPDGEAQTAEAVMLSDEYYVAAAAKRRGLGLVQFIGELYKLGMLTERIMHECVKKLVDYEGIPDEAEVESLTKLLRTIGSNLDNTDKGRPLMDVYFQRIQAMMDTPDLPSRLQFMLLDIVDLRKKGWQSKEANKGPQTIQEIREEAQRQAAEKDAERARQQNQRHHGGGGRMPMGRGDARSFSGGGQYGMTPPPDLQRNTVGMDDLRRLGSKAGSRQASQGGPVSFGPTAMFNSRSSSGRKTLGPSSGLSRGGEESGASSRTGTPPAAKDKDATTSANAFSALAGLDASGEPTGATSPPSTTSSPPMTKAKLPEEKGKASGKDKDDGPRAGS
ncbi:MAG: hypothetical protein M1832_003566 [Thelocarpon impressellum]|nr:MAG: hypothetical protein M1832_003566 [Thelocarpon impressellum]